jgi:hypothetical protein
MIQPEEERALTVLFNSDHFFSRSSFGLQLDHALEAGSTSNGHRVGRGRSWHWNPPLPGGKLQRPPPTYVSYAARQGGSNHGYEVSHGRLMDLGEASTRALRLYRAPAPARDQPSSGKVSFYVLQAFYGERGARWAQAALTRYELDPKGERLQADGKDVIAYEGLGPGAIAAVFPFTPAGQELCRWEAAQRDRPQKQPKPKQKQGKHRRRAPTEHQLRIATYHRRKAELMTAIERLVGQVGHLGQAAAKAHDPVHAAQRAFDLVRGQEGTPRRAAAKVLKAAKDAAQPVVEAHKLALGHLIMLRGELTYLNTSPPVAPILGEDERRGLQDVLAERKRLHAAHDAALKAWRAAAEEARRARQAAPPTPPTPVLPPLPVPRLPTHHASAPPPRLNPDDQLTISLLLDRLSANSHRKLLLVRAQCQANELLFKAWYDWQGTASRPPRAPFARTQVYHAPAPPPETPLP